MTGARGAKMAASTSIHWNDSDRNARAPSGTVADCAAIPGAPSIRIEAAALTVTSRTRYHTATKRAAFRAFQPARPWRLRFEPVSWLISSANRVSAPRTRRASTSARSIAFIPGRTKGISRRPKCFIFTPTSASTVAPAYRRARSTPYSRWTRPPQVVVVHHEEPGLFQRRSALSLRGEPAFAPRARGFDWS